MNVMKETFPGPALVSNENEAEIFSLLIGCRELKVMSGFQEIIDAILAIDWGSNALQYPWKFAGWVEKIRCISL